jgi:uncharacterized membrane protein (UPF0127 family)
MRKVSQLPKDGRIYIGLFPYVFFPPPLRLDGGGVFIFKEVSSLRLVNLDNGQTVSDSIELAVTFLTRLKGLMFRAQLSQGGGLYLHPCKSIHTFFMKFPIDVLYLNKDWKIVGLEEQLQPGKIGRNVPGAVSVIELESGSIQKNSIKEGQIVKLLKN